MALTYSTMMELGTMAPDFSLPGTDGQLWRRDDAKGTRGTLIVFTCNHCPYAKAVEDRLIAIGRDYQPRGIGIVLINSNDAENYPEDSFDKMKERAAARNYPFPYLFDESQDVARAYHAACTPDPFLFDRHLRLYYRGRIDDNWQEPDKVRRHDLRDALDLLLADKPAPVEQLPSMGCNIKWKE